MDVEICSFCGKTFSKKGIGTHVWRNHGDGRGHNPNIGYKKDREVWNKNKNKENHNSILLASIKFKEGIKSGRIKTWKGRKHSSETILKLCKNAGGYRRGSGRGKHGKYKGIYCDSTWELAWVVYQTHHKVIFKRFDGFFEYEFLGRKHKYYPDFILQDGTLIEIKGYETKRDLVKYKSVIGHTLIILKRDEIEKIINWVKETFNIEDLTHLYDREL